MILQTISWLIIVNAILNNLECIFKLIKGYINGAAKGRMSSKLNTYLPKESIINATPPKYFESSSWSHSRFSLGLIYSALLTFFFFAYLSMSLSMTSAGLAVVSLVYLILSLFSDIFCINIFFKFIIKLIKLDGG